MIHMSCHLSVFFVKALSVAWDVLLRMARNATVWPLFGA